MAHLQTTGLLEEENGAAPIPADVVHLKENGCTVSNNEARADMVSDIALGVNDKLLSPTNVNQQAESGPCVGDLRLSDGWKAVLHGESGRYYFWNTVTGETTWETPLAVDPEEKPSEPLQQALVTEANTSVREILPAEACREVGNSVSDPDGRRYEGDGVSGPVESFNTDDYSVQPAQQVSESLSGEDVPAFGEQVLVSDTQPSAPVSGECSLQNDSEGLASHEEGEVEVQDEGRNQGGCEETSTAISSKNNAVDMENKHRKLIIWGQSVASRLETLAGSVSDPL